MNAIKKVSNGIEAESRKKSKKFPISWKLGFQGLPLVAAAGASFLPLQWLGQQFLVLIVLIWIQVFIIFECFLLF